MNISQLKNIKIKDIYKWPLLSQCIVGSLLMIALIALGTFLFLIEQYSQLEKEKNKEETLKTEFVNKTKQAVNLKLYQQQLIEITQASDMLLKQLPNKSEVEKLLIDINQSGVGRGLQFELFKPNQEKITDYYAELPISIKLVGSYDSIGKFSSDVSQLSRVVILKDVNITNANNSGLLTMTAVAQTFRYLDQDEIDHQKAQKKEKLKKMKKGEK